MRRLAASVGGCLLLLGAASAAAQPRAYALDPAHTHVHWEVRHFGTSTSRGRFDDVQGSLSLDNAAGTGEVSIVVGTASVNTGVAPLDGVLRRDYLAAAAHPQAYFVASGWHWKADAPLQVHGELTLHGVSRPVVLRSPQLHCYPHPQLQREVCGADLEGELQRSDFGITDGLPFIADRVRLVIQVEAIRQGAVR
ncbi:MAG: YceI family protein [Rhizobacter sp.]|nr:YceI family protein [Rhizobacter sp.]